MYLLKYTNRTIQTTFRTVWAKRQRNSANENRELNAERDAIPTNKPTVSIRRSRVMNREDPSKAFRKIVKKPFLKSGDTEYDSYVREWMIYLFRLLILLGM